MSPLTRRRRLVSADEATVVTRQHVRPCGDCPWRVDALPGWTGDQDAVAWLADAHGDAAIDCHTRRYADQTRPACAGAATYRANVCKVPRDPAALRLPADRTRVFATAAAFLAYHAGDDAP